MANTCFIGLHIEGMAMFYTIHINHSGSKGRDGWRSVLCTSNHSPGAKGDKGMYFYLYFACILHMTTRTTNMPSAYATAIPKLTAR